MPLVEFRKVQLPETAGGKVVCQLDPETEDTRPLRELMSAGAEEAAGVRGCGFYRLGRVSGPAFAPLPPEWISQRLKLTDTEVAPVFWFVPDPADGKTLRLFRIVLHTNVMQWERVVADTTRRHGQPSNVTKTPTVLGAGGRWDNVVMRWQAGDEELVLTKRDGRTERMGVQYLDRRLSVAATSQSAADADGSGLPGAAAACTAGAHSGMPGRRRADAVGRLPSAEGVTTVDWRCSGVAGCWRPENANKRTQTP